jgi:hypothetical protein
LNTPTSDTGVGGNGSPPVPSTLWVSDMLDKERLDREQADCRLDMRINELQCFTHDIYAVVRREVLVLRTCVVVFTLMSFAAQFGYVHHLSGILGLACAVVLLYNWVASRRWVQRRVRNALIAWDTWRLKRSR